MICMCTPFRLATCFIWLIAKVDENVRKSTLSKVVGVRVKGLTPNKSKILLLHAYHVKVPVQVRKCTFTDL